MDTKNAILMVAVFSSSYTKLFQQAQQEPLLTFRVPYNMFWHFLVIAW
jgi:hypothetical protein